MTTLWLRRRGERWHRVEAGCAPIGHDAGVEWYSADGRNVPLVGEACATCARSALRCVEEA